jgi:hypothetical protein
VANFHAMFGKLPTFLKGNLEKTCLMIAGNSSTFFLRNALYIIGYYEIISFLMPAVS